MAEVMPFKGLRFRDDIDLAQVTTPPYDIISPKQQDEFYEKDEYNVIRLELGKTFPGDDTRNNCYTRANEYLTRWMDEGVLAKEDDDAFYICEQSFMTDVGVRKSLKGIIGAVRLEEFSAGVILPHEETLPKAKTDRFNLMCATGANFSQVYSLYPDDDLTLPSIIRRLSERKPDASFESFDGITQNIWIVKDKSDTEAITSGFKNKQLYIADGHHRYETALNYRNKMAEENPGHTGDEPYNYLMMMLVEMYNEGLIIFPTHRLIRNLDLNIDNFVYYAKDYFEVRKTMVDQQENYIGSLIEAELAKYSGTNAYAMYVGKDTFYTFILKDRACMDEILPDKSEHYRRLDATVLHALIIEKLLGISKQNVADQINLTYTRDIDEAINEVNAGNCRCSFILNATKIEQIKNICTAGEKMPQKSTYFWPKLITGMVMNKF